MLGIFLSIFYCHYCVVQIQSLTEFQNLILHLFHFNNSYFIAIVKVLFVMHYPLEKHFREGYIFSVFYSEYAFSNNLAGLKLQIFYSLLQSTMGPL